MPESPPGVLVRCAACGGVTPSPGASRAGSAPQIPATIAQMPSAGPPVFGPSIKGAASPPPANPGTSTAGGVDEIVGAGALLLGFFTVKTAVLFALSLMMSCVIGMLALVLHC
jgi:hypothetical protein